MGNKPIVHAPIATGSTEPRDIRDRFADWCNVKDFGAKGDGLTDDSSAFLAAQASGAPAIMVPEGSYYITEDIPGIFYSFGEVEKTGIGNVTIINLLANGSVPVGTVIWLSTITVPAGFLLCNGQAVSRTTYPDLFNAIGTTYGAGDGSTTFNLPNLIDKFIEGANSNIGDSVAAGLPNITGYANSIFCGYSQSGNASSAIEYTATIDKASIGNGSSNGWGNLHLNASRANSIYGNSATVQPPAVKLLPCIKAYSDVDNLGSLDAAQLENYVQNNVVHNTGDETISGDKTFAKTIYADDNYCVLVPTLYASKALIYYYDAINELTKANITHTVYGNDVTSLQIAIWGDDANRTKAAVYVDPKSGTTATNQFYPQGNNGMSLGLSNHRWTAVYAATGSIQTSDERMKSNIEPFSDDVLDAWGDVNFVKFQYNDSLQEKGSSARLHSGLVAQHIEQAFRRRGLDASRYGLFCWDEWDADPEKGVEEAGDQYSLRYEEALCMEAAYQRRRADRAEARIASLEERLAALEAKLEQ